MAKSRTMTALCLVLTSFLLHTSLASSVPDLDEQARKLFRDLDESMHPHLTYPDTDNPSNDGIRYPLLTSYKIYLTQGETPEQGVALTADVLYAKLTRPGIKFYSDPQNRPLRKKILGSIYLYLDTYRSNGVEDVNIPGFENLNNTTTTTEDFVRVYDPEDHKKSSDGHKEI